DLAPTILRLMGIPVPADMDGRVLHELLDPAVIAVPAADVAPPASTPHSAMPLAGVAYTDEEDAAIQQRLADLGYL
ncbi:MAG: phosphodiesterase, partial [Planctomycetota bacterium]|nr:phosphodiesterase [Planctomycetota bacterium]